MSSLGGHCQTVQELILKVHTTNQQLALLVRQKIRPNIAKLNHHLGLLEEIYAQAADSLWPIERVFPNLKEQLAKQKELYERLGIIEPIGWDQLGFEGVNGVAYAFPSTEVIKWFIRKNRTLIAQKVKQKFTTLLLVPFGMPLAQLVDKVDKVFTGDWSARDANNQRLALTSPSIMIDSDILEPDFLEYRSGNLKLSKQEILEERNKRGHEQDLGAWRYTSLAGWNVLLVADPTAHAQTPKKPSEFIEEFQQNPEYTGEVPLTLEDYLAYLLYYYETHNQQLLDGDGWSYQLGNVITSTGRPMVLETGYSIGSHQIQTFKISFNAANITRRAHTAVLLNS